MLVRYEPRKTLNLFEKFFNGALDECCHEPEFQNMRFNADIVEEKDKYLLHADLPGLTEKEVKIELEDGYLTISGERKSEKKENNDGEVLRSERYYGKFQRSFRLGNNVEIDKVKASFKNGELTINLPKSEKAKSKLIPIN